MSSNDHPHRHLTRTVGPSVRLLQFNCEWMSRSKKNVCKSPIIVWPENVIATDCGSPPTVYRGDFNSHHTPWGYTSYNKDREMVVEWEEALHPIRCQSKQNLPLCNVAKELLARSLVCQQKSIWSKYSVVFSMAELTTNMEKMKFKKATGPDGVFQ